MLQTWVVCISLTSHRKGRKKNLSKKTTSRRQQKYSNTNDLLVVFYNIGKISSLWKAFLCTQTHKHIVLTLGNVKLITVCPTGSFYNHHARSGTALLNKSPLEFLAVKQYSFYHGSCLLYIYRTWEKADPFSQMFTTYTYNTKHALTWTP